ncbi:MAG: ABC transporter substrate-binding protein, partial [Gammaproteobacteria bacterium]|nr:ABC transporter substrate-binding protein [Gammaproteobacteria bacterium]
MIRSVQLAIAASLLIAGGAAADDSPNAVVLDAVTLLAEQLDGRKEELAENREQLYEIIDGILLPRFDRRFAAQLVLARHWRTASPEQQQRFIEAFY